MTNLFDYMQNVERLVGDMRQQLVNTGDIQVYINTARKQVAGEGECVRVLGTLALTQGVNSYPFSAINVSGTAGVQGPYNARMVLIAVASGQTLIKNDPWEWFVLYHLNNPVPTQSIPTSWSQFGQGVNGSLYFSNIPDTNYTATVDTSCMPVNLTDDTTAEAIPYPWTDAVPYFAAYLAYLENQRGDDAQRMYALYEMFTTRARKMSTSAVLPHHFEQQPNVTRPNQLGQISRKPPAQAVG
jgi:hypothetical protein